MPFTRRKRQLRPSVITCMVCRRAWQLEDEELSKQEYERHLPFCDKEAA